MSVRLIHLRIEDANGLYRVGENLPTRRYQLPGDPFVIDGHKLREFSIVQVDDAGGFTGSVDVDYRLTRKSAWASLQDNLVSGTRYTHANVTATTVVYHPTLFTHLPIQALGVDCDSYTTGGTDVFIILCEED